MDVVIEGTLLHLVEPGIEGVPPRGARWIRGRVGHAAIVARDKPQRPPRGWTPGKRGWSLGAILPEGRPPADPVAGSSVTLIATIYMFEIRRLRALALRVARHQSETAEYLHTRVLAYRLEFAKGIAFSQVLANRTSQPRSSAT
jgi:hypothetical protein